MRAQRAKITAPPRRSLHWVGLALLALLGQYTLTPCLCFARTQPHAQPAVRPIRLKSAHCGKCRPAAKKNEQPSDQRQCHRKLPPPHPGGRCCGHQDAAPYLAASAGLLPPRLITHDAAFFSVVALPSTALELDDAISIHHGRDGPDELTSQLRHSPLLGRAPPISA